MVRTGLIGNFLSLLLLATPPAVDPTPEPVRWLREYLQIDTTNPPGNERPAAELLAGILTAEGIPARLLVSPGGRTSLYARLAAADGDGRAIALIHHLDVVPAGESWRVDPFSGRPLEAGIWGRGAIDVKSLGVAHLAAMIALKREAAPLRRDLIFLAVADEELGGKEGTGWLLDAHPELFAGLECVLNEGGSNRVILDRVVWWGVEVEQKRPLWLKVTAGGRGGHASGLNVQSATHVLIGGLARLLERPLRYRVTDAARRFLGALAEVEGGFSEKLYHRLDEVIREDGPTEQLPPGLPVLFLDTLQITELRGSRAINVVAPEASALIDLRLLPDTDAEAELEEIRLLLGPQIEVEVLLSSPPVPASTTTGAYYRALERVLGVRAPVVPTFLAGITDSRYFRRRGIAAYGLSPFAIDALGMRGVHAADEHIPRDELLRGVELMRRVVLALAGPQLVDGGESST